MVHYLREKNIQNWAMETLTVILELIIYSCKQKPINDNHLGQGDESQYLMKQPKKHHVFIWDETWFSSEIKHLHFNETFYWLTQLRQGLKCRSQATGHRPGHRPDHRSHTKTIGHWTKLFLIDILLYKNKTSQGTSIIFFLFWTLPNSTLMLITQGELALQRNQSW